MRVSLVLAVLTLVGSAVIVGGVAGAADSSAARSYESVTAASLVVDGQEEQRYLEEMQTLADRFGLENRENAFILTDGEKTWRGPSLSRRRTTSAVRSSLTLSHSTRKASRWTLAR